MLTSSEVVSLPLFILMGELLFRTRLSQSLFTGIAPWMGFLPGRLLHTTVIGCSMFAAISGSSAATTQVVGRITLTELLRRGYDKDIAVGSLAGAGTLGFPDPALDPDDHLCRAGGGIAPAAVHGGLPAGLRARRLLHGWVHAIRALRPDSCRSTTGGCRNGAGRSTSSRAWSSWDRSAFLILTVLGTMYLGIASPRKRRRSAWWARCW